MSEQTNIKVVVRLRPYNRRELELNQRCIIRTLDKQTLLFDPDDDEEEFFYHGVRQNFRDVTKRVNKKMSMEYDRVFDVESTNIEIFNECLAPLVDGVLEGFNCSVFVYGATGAGKTHTMLGNNANPGLTFLTMRDLFNKMHAQRDVRTFEVAVSYLEVYNEKIRNLLVKSGPLRLMEDNTGGVVVSGLQLQKINSADELLQMLVNGNANRTQHPTDANAESSRSHAIFQVHLRVTEISTSANRTVKLSMIDLAGSERAASTKGVGMRFKEGACINKSLLALGNCINKLADGLKHIPYRDSNLTRILKDSLGGNCQTLMVANVSMSSLTYDDTYNTLKYASRAKKIRTTLKQNMVKSNMPKEYYMRKLTEMTIELETFKKNSKLMQQQRVPQQLDDPALTIWQKRIDAAYTAVVDAQCHCMLLKSKLKHMNLRVKLLQDSAEYRQLFHLKEQTHQIEIEEQILLDQEIVERTMELSHALPKLEAAQKEWERVKQECSSQASGTYLDVYIKYKELKLKHDRQKLNNDHISNISAEMVTNASKLSEAFKLSLNVLSNEDIAKSEPHKYEQLQQLFSTENAFMCGRQYCQQEVNKHKRALEPTPLKGVNSNNKENASSAAKITRSCDLTYNDIDLGVYIDSEDIDSVDEEPLRNVSNVDLKNSTFAVRPAKQRQRAQNLFAEQLIESTVNKTEQIKNALIKTNKSLRVPMKDQKRHSGNRISKSPRNGVAKALATNTNFLRNLIKRGDCEELAPVVRVNRAALLRCKKES